MISDSDIVEFLSGNGMFLQYLRGMENEEDACIIGFCSLQKLKNFCVTWIKRGSNDLEEVFGSVDNLLVIAEQPVRIEGKNIRCIVVPYAKRAYFRILRHFFSGREEAGTSPTAVVESSTVSAAAIGPFCYIGPDVKIGRGTVLGTHVSIVGTCEIGENVLIHSGVRIGTDGFGYFMDENNIPEKVPHFGGVKIGNRVEIGANTCIDRGTLDDTVIEDDVKIDNLCHIAHNVRIGKGAMVVAQSLICGSADIGERAYIAPGAIVKNQLSVGGDAFVGMGAVVVKDVESGMVVAGVPAVERRKVMPEDK